MLKAREVCDREAKGIPYVMIISYIIDKGQATISQIEDEDIDTLEGNGLMTADFVKGLVKAARAVVKECDQNDIVRLIKAEWSLDGEVRHPYEDRLVEGKDLRMRELAEQAICYLKDRDEVEDFSEEWGIEFDEEERSYFGIYEEGEDE